MGSLGQQLEELNKQYTALYEEVKAAFEACKTAADARARAELACSESPEDKDLQMLRDTAVKEEQRTKEACCFWQQEVKQLNDMRAQVVAKLPGEGVRSLLHMVCLKGTPGSECSIQWDVNRAQHHVYALARQDHSGADVMGWLWLYGCWPFSGIAQILSSLLRAILCCRKVRNICHDAFVAISQ